MDGFQRSWYRLLAKNDYLETKRQEFQAWAGKIFQLAFSDNYIPIRLTQGDGGLDGIILSQEAVVAVYAPREASKSVLENKIASDFSKASGTLSEHNAKLRKFIFVHNDEGLVKEVSVSLLALRQSNSDVEIEIWTFERLWTLMEQKLTDHQFQDLLGEAPTSQVMDRLEMPAIREVIEYLASVKAEPSPLGLITIPDPDKLEYNKLNPNNKHLLHGGRLKQGKVSEYLRGMTDPTTGERIAEGFRRKYAACRESGMMPDEIFEALWHFSGGNYFSRPDQLAGVTAVMSHFFDSCDIFENVPKTI
jgi:hypothetical protein